VCQELIVIKIRLYWAYLEINSTNCILEFPQTHINARFLTHIDNYGSSPDDRYHLEIEGCIPNPLDS
jgi:hypothetical protein